MTRLRPAGRVRACSTALVLALASLLPGVPAASAQETETATMPDVRLVVTSLDGVVGPAVDPPEEGEEAAPADLGLRVLVENQDDVDVQDLQLVVEVHDSVEGARSLLTQALDQQAVRGESPTIERVDVRDGGAVPAGDIAGEQITIDGAAIGWAGTNDVYPVQVSVLYGSEVLDSVMTAVVHLEDAEKIARPLQTTVVWPLSAPTTRTATGRYPDAVPEDLAPGGRIDGLLAAVEANPEVPVLLAPETELVEELADRADGFTLVDGTEIASDDPAAVNASRLLERMRQVVEAAELAPVVGPYGRADVAALVTAPDGISQMAEAAIDAARARAQSLLGRAPDDQLYLSTTPLTPASLELTGDGTHLLLPAAQVQGVDLAEDLAVGHARQMVPELLSPSQRLATVADPGVAAVVADPPVDAGPAVARQRLVAETAVLHLTRPSEGGRSLLVLPPIQWDPDPGTAGAVLAALRASPWLELTGPAEAEPAGVTRRTALSTAAAALPGSVAAELIATREQLDALRAAMPSELPDLGGQTVADLDDALLRALTPEALADAGAESLARIRAVRAVTEDAFGEVALPEDAAVTLTSDTGQVPVTLERTRGGDIELRVEVSSGAGLVWDQGAQSQHVTLPEGASRTVSFGARAAARGTFAVTVSVWDPTGRKLLDRATLSVRSTAISRTALLVIGGVVLVLLAVGARRRRSPSLEVVR